MVKFIIARQLVGKKVITSDGFDVGRLFDVEISEVTGKIINLVVEPNLDSGLANKMKIEGGQIKIPYNSVLAVNDYAVVDRKNW
ncbi:MAG: PRC-barrel domain-containing protein [Candidatus Micrarchaeales archaeon]|nr:PRC-barrel domain-containing protein [Candidatus Micrarchaeales archaeon]